MAISKLEAEMRASGKGSARSSRRQGRVPGVVYGKTFENQPISIDERSLKAFLASPRRVIELSVGGKKANVMVRELQRDPVKGDILHVDFLAISMKDKLETTVLVNVVGEDEVRRKGGILQYQMREINIKCLPTEIPDSVEVDVSELDIGERFTVGDLDLGPGIEVLDSPEEVIVAVLAPKAEEPAAEPEGEAQTAEEAGEETAEEETEEA